MSFLIVRFLMTMVGSNIFLGRVHAEHVIVNTSVATKSLTEFEHREKH